MTVAAVIVAGPDDPLADALGRSAGRRIVDAAWAGGAMPIIVVAADPDGLVGRSLEGSPADLVTPVAGAPDDGYLAGLEHARAVVGDTAAVLLWPMSMTWVDPETVTSLIEAHGRQRGRPLRAAYDGVAGWPALLPVDVAAEVRAAADQPGLAGIMAAIGDIDQIELGDPGATHGIDVEMEGLPDFEGPAGPVGGPPPEWGAAAADSPD